MKNTIDLTGVPVFLDGSDGSLWQARNAWEQLLREPDIARKRFVKVSDLLAVLKDFNLAVGNVDTEPITEGPSRHPMKFDNAGNLIPHDRLFEANKKDYLCPKCGTKEARFIAPVVNCPVCGGELI